MNLRFIDWIWKVNGSLALAPGQFPEDAFGRLDPLFHEPGTFHRRAGDTLVFDKKDPAAQDRLSVFEHGVLHVEKSPAGPVLRYQLTSKSLLLCFLAPLLFLAFAQANIALGKLESPAAKESAEKQKPKVVVPLNPIDKFLGAPEPDKEMKSKAEDRAAKKHSPTPAYVFAGIFAVLWLVGRVLEDRLVLSLFRKRLGAAPA